jgi:glycosyltransferase
MLSPHQNGYAGPRKLRDPKVMMKVTLITPTFNSATTLRDTLDSIQAQDYPSIEHIIVDGGSKDDTMTIAATYPHISRIISEPDNGLYDAMNKGLRAATGNIVGILNSDDFYANNRIISSVVDRLSKTGCDALYGDLLYVEARDTGKVIRYWKSRPFKPALFYRGWMPPHPTFFVRRTIYEQFGGFNLDFRFSADYELMLRFLFKHRVSVCYLPETMVLMRTGGMSNASLSNRVSANREDQKAWKVNGLRPRFYTRYLKPISKLRQFWAPI